jgi:hypothetical protein
MILKFAAASLSACRLPFEAVPLLWAAARLSFADLERPDNRVVVTIVCLTDSSIACCRDPATSLMRHQ